MDAELTPSGLSATLPSQPEFKVPAPHVSHVVGTPSTSKGSTASSVRKPKRRKRRWWKKPVEAETVSAEATPLSGHSQEPEPVPVPLISLPLVPATPAPTAQVVLLPAVPKVADIVEKTTMPFPGSIGYVLLVEPDAVICVQRVYDTLSLKWFRLPTGHYRVIGRSGGRYNIPAAEIQKNVDALKLVKVNLDNFDAEVPMPG